MSERHGLSRTKVYLAWRGMKDRCLNPNNPSFADYGGRSIKVCERWAASFLAFLADMGKPPRGASIDRIDVDGDYEPGNCRWATRLEQQNNLRSNRVLELDGRKMTSSEWSRELGISINTLNSRLKNGWDDQRALTTPVANKFAPLAYRG